MKEVTIKYGIRAGLIMIALSWLNFFVTRGMSVSIGQIGGMVSIILSLIMAMRSVPALKKSVHPEVTTFWQEFFTGAISSAIAAGLIFVSTVVFMLTMRESYAEWAGGGEAANAVVMHPVEQGVIMFIMVLTIGSLMSLLLAVISYSRRG
jgi:hypothetical protein